MPYCKSVAIHGHVDKTLSYILDPDKTEELKYTTSINCMTEAELAYQQMKAVYEQYSRRSYEAPQSKSGKSAVKAIHYIISFADSENVTPELAHKIAKALVRKNFGEDAQAVIATHTNTDHVHCHVLVNSYSISGQRFYDNKKSLRIVRETTNGICRVFSVTPALNFENKGRSISYYEWECKKNGVSWKEHIRQSIDSLIPSVSSFDELIAELERRGFTVKRDKYIYIKAPGQLRSVSLWKLGEDYTEESLNARILWRMVTQSKARNAVNNDPDIYAQLSVINRDSITSIGDLEGRIDKQTAEYNSMQEQLSDKLLKQEQMQQVIDYCEKYFILSGRNDLSDDDKLLLETYKSCAELNNISSPDDIISLRERNSKLLSEISTLKNSIYKKRISVYSTTGTLKRASRFSALCL